MRKGAARLLNANLGEWDLRAYFDRYWPLASSKTHSGVEVTHDVAMTLSSVWQATILYSSVVATLPKTFSRVLTNGKTEPATDHPLSRIFTEMVNPSMSTVNYFTLVMPWVINQGNCVNILRFDGSGRTREVWPVHPSRVAWHEIKPSPEDRKLRYPIIDDEGRRRVYHQDDILHIPGLFTQNGYVFEGVIPYASESIGTSLATNYYGARFYQNDAHAGTIVQVPTKMSQGPYDRLKATWADRTGVENAHTPVILEEGATIDRLGIHPAQAQYLESRRFDITEVARWYNLPVHMLKEMQDSGVRANIESESISFVIYSLLHWLVRVEETCRLQLLHPKDWHRFKFAIEVKGLLRGDLESRAAFYKELFAMAALSPNDALRLEDMEPLDGPVGDMRFVPANYMTVEQHIAVTKQAEKEAEQPLPDPNQAPPPGPTQTPQQESEQSRDNNLENRIRKQFKKVFARFDELPKENGHLKREDFNDYMDKLRKEGLPVNLSEIPHLDPPPREQTLEEKVLSFSALFLMHSVKSLENAGKFPDKAQELYETILPNLVDKEANPELHSTLEVHYEKVQTFYDLPCQDLQPAVTSFVETELCRNASPA